jgi:hypothetical protein
VRARHRHVDDHDADRIPAHTEAVRYSHDVMISYPAAVDRIIREDAHTG